MKMSFCSTGIEIHFAGFFVGGVCFIYLFVFRIVVMQSLRLTIPNTRVVPPDNIYIYIYGYLGPGWASVMRLGLKTVVRHHKVTTR